MTTNAASGEPKKLWGGAFSEKIDPLMEKFNESLSFDRQCVGRLEGSIGYASALARTGIITEEERNEIHKGLKKVLEEWQNDTFVAKEGDEDIHTVMTTVVRSHRLEHWREVTHWEVKERSSRHGHENVVTKRTDSVEKAFANVD